MIERRFLSLACVLAFAAACGGEQTGVPKGGGGGSGSVMVSAPELTALNPHTWVGGEEFVVTAQGRDFIEGDHIVVDGQAMETTWVSAKALTATVPPLSRGSYDTWVRRDEVDSDALPLTIENSPPVLVDPGAQVVDEDALLELVVDVSDFDDDPLRVFATGLPPGASWNELTRTIRFVPDFIQGGDAWDVAILVDDGTETASVTFSITVNDSISPPVPEVLTQTEQSTHFRLKLSQVSDEYLDSPGYAGRSFEARVVVPKDASLDNKYPVRVFLHGLGGSPYTGGTGNQFRIYPHDPSNTYWWGYSEQLPEGEPTTGKVFNYTQRRVLHLLEWVLRTYPGADPERVYVSGSSMGGAGAAALGLLYARHFCYVHSLLGQLVARNHRPSRVAQLSGYWGAPGLNLPDASGMGNWDRADMTRALKDDPEARQQFLFTRHAKDDATIHFGAVTIASPLTEQSYYQVIQEEGIGHYAVWDEGGHGPADPVMGSNWWGAPDWVFDEESYLRRSLPFAALSRSEVDQDPGDGTGNGKQTWGSTSGYAGNVSTPGDTGWTGDVAGVMGRYFRWNSPSIVDEIDRLEIPIKIAHGDGTEMQAGYPPKGALLLATLPITGDVTVRRAQRFRCYAGEEVRWTFGLESGTAVAKSDGSVTITGLALSDVYTSLELERM